jgi:ketopantoate reductase
MRITVLGSGAIGGYYGALPAKGGHDVAFAARGAHSMVRALRGGAGGRRLVRRDSVACDSPRSRRRRAFDPTRHSQPHGGST